jgi:pyruvate-ferredoxin/flavodoxin oxidoreductase
LQAVDGRRPNGMSVMMMGASTGCNTVYGSTPPANPHPVSLDELAVSGRRDDFLADGGVGDFDARTPTLGGSGALADALLTGTDGVMTEADYFTLTIWTTR